jgi:hypothetical protein
VYGKILWRIGNAAEALILACSTNVSLYENYPAFYFHLSIFFLIELLCFSLLAFGFLQGYALRSEWRYVQPIVYLVALFIWGCTLWSYQPNPKAKIESDSERDRGLLAEQIIKVLSTLRSFLKIGGEL